MSIYMTHTKTYLHKHTQLQGDRVFSEHLNRGEALEGAEEVALISMSGSLCPQSLLHLH